MKFHESSEYCVYTERNCAYVRVRCNEYYLREHTYPDLVATILRYKQALCWTRYNKWFDCSWNKRQLYVLSLRFMNVFLWTVLILHHFWLFQVIFAWYEQSNHIQLPAFRCNYYSVKGLVNSSDSIHRYPEQNSNLFWTFWANKNLLLHNKNVNHLETD